MAKIAISAIRHAAAELISKSRPVSAANLAEISGFPSDDIREFVKIIHGLAAEIQFTEVTIHETIAFEYKAAAERLRQKGGTVTIAALAGELEVKYSTSKAWLERHPQERKELGVISGGEAKKQKRMKKWMDAARKLREVGLPVSITAIVAKTRYTRNVIYRDLSKEPLLSGFLGVLVAARR
jgi:hypothetical protein